jgi:hypothetical protein
VTWLLQLEAIGVVRKVGRSGKLENRKTKQKEPHPTPKKDITYLEILFTYFFYKNKRIGNVKMTCLSHHRSG